MTLCLQTVLQLRDLYKILNLLYILSGSTTPQVSINLLTIVSSHNNSYLLIYENYQGQNVKHRAKFVSIRQAVKTGQRLKRMRVEIFSYLRVSASYELNKNRYSISSLLNPTHLKTLNRFPLTLSQSINFLW